MMDSYIIDSIVKKYYNVSDVENTKYSMIFHIRTRGSEKSFTYLLEELDKIGTTAFTNDFPDNQIIVINNRNIGRDRNGLKAMMLFISIATLVYSGFIYYSAYYSSVSIYRNIIYGSIFYALPVIFVLLSREFGKYLALRKNHIKYKFPIFIPSPGIGTLGTINSNKNQFRDSRSMIETGSFSLLFGFFASIFFIVVGAATMPFTQYNASIHSPISILNFPLVFPVVLEHFFPALIIPDPLELAGYVGLITTAINALPIGFMDGGLVFSGIMGKSFKYASYAGIVILLIAGIIYPYILILVVLSLLLGIRGPLPMNTFFKPKISMKASWALIIIIILLLGFVPLPFHSTGNSNVAIPNSCYVMQQNNTGNVTVNITVQNHGLNVVPVFSVSPGNFSVERSIQNNMTTTTYTLELITYHYNYTGKKDFNITVNTGTEIFHKMISVYFLKDNKNIHFTNISNPLNLTEYQGKPFNITIDNNGSFPLNVRIISISTSMGVYMEGSDNTTINLAGDPYEGISTHIRPWKNETMNFEAETPGTWKIIIMESNGEAAIVDIHIKPAPVSPPNPKSFNGSQNNDNALNSIHSLYYF